MTTHKSFKRVVRARMAKTGERYATARRALLGGAPEGTQDPAETAAGAYRYRGGLHPQTASLANVLAHLDLRSPIDGEPLSEATVLVLGGGLGAGYILWEFQARDGAILTLGFINRWQYPAVPGWTARPAPLCCTMCLASPATLATTGVSQAMISKSLEGTVSWKMGIGANGTRQAVQAL